MRAKDRLNYLLDNYDFKTVLDYGCGRQTPHRASFERAGKSWCGIDRERNGDVILLGTQQEAYDCLWCCHYFEHERDQDALLGRIHYLLKPGGLLCITVPVMDDFIVGGHVNLFNAGLLMYRLVLNGFDCSAAAVRSDHRDITVIVRKPVEGFELPQLDNDSGDIERIAQYMPEGCRQQRFDGRIEYLNWGESVNSNRKEIYLVGSGPSAQGVKIPPGAKVACVNGSYACIEQLPDYYMVGELKAAEAYAGFVTQLIDEGRTVYMRPGAVQRYFEQPGATKVAKNYLNQRVVRPIDFSFGPDKLHYLHWDSELPRGSRGRPRAPWMSSGVLMLWVLCEKYKPDRIVMVGFDGYPVDANQPSLGGGVDRPAGDIEIEGEYAAAVKALPSRPVRCESWTIEMNLRMAGGIDAISNQYPDTEIHFPTRPHHWQPTWRATYGEK